MAHATTQARSGETTARSALSDLLAERYGTDRAAGAGPDNEVLKALLSHRSIRAFASDPVPEADVSLALAAAQSAASSSNMQLWSVVSLTDPERKRRLRALAGDQAQIAEAPLLLVWLVDLSRLRAIAARETETSEGLDYLESFLTGTIDAALAAQNAAVALESMGYGTCYIGAMRNHPVEVAAELALPPEVFAVFGMTVGRLKAPSEAAIKPRLSQDIVWHREQYDAASPEAEISRYNAIVDAFQAAQAMPAMAWTAKVAQRVRTPGALKNRDKLRDFLAALGFRLR